jgi:hypothetical protein
MPSKAQQHFIDLVGRLRQFTAVYEELDYDAENKLLDITGGEHHSEWYDETIFQQLCSDDRMNRVWDAVSTVSDEAGLKFLVGIISARNHSLVTKRSLLDTPRDIELAREMRAAIKKLLKLIKRAEPAGLMPVMRRGDVETPWPISDWLKAFDRKLDGTIGDLTSVVDLCTGMTSRKSRGTHVELLSFLAGATEEVFGQPRYDIVADVAGVILNAAISSEKVRSARRNQKHKITLFD